MEYENKTKDQLIDEIRKLQLRVACLEAGENKSWDTEEKLYVVKEPKRSDEKFVSFSIDISDHERIQKELNEIRTRYRLILDAMPAHISYVDTEQNIRFINKWHEKWFNHHPKEIVGRNIRELLGGVLYGKIEGYIRSALKGNDVIFETVISKKPLLRHLAVTLIPNRDDAGAVLGFYILAYDITDRIMVEEALKKSEAQLAEAQQIASLGSWEFDLRKNAILLSAELYRICDLDPKMFRLTFREILRLIHHEDLGIFKAAIETAYRTRSPFSVYHRIVRPNGTTRVLHSQGNVIAGDDGKPLRIIGTAQDVTARKKAEETLKRKHLELKQLNRSLEKKVEEEVANNRQKDYLLIQQGRQAAMGEMIGNIAHQWRQPLTTISLLIQNLHESFSYGDFSGEFMDKTIEHVMQVIQHMSRTIDDFRNFFKPDKERSTFIMGDVIQKTISFVEPSMRFQNITVDVLADNDLTVNGYPNECAQVFLNILSNARDVIIERKIASPEILIKACRKKGKTIVTIWDNAGGIPENIIDKVFEPYFTTKELGKGTGVGLYMSKTIIEKHMGGKLGVKNVNGGAEFRIEI
jgi:PAS domain S-box-containing protein